MRYVALLRGINVGGKAVIRMADLRDCALELGLDDVSTYIASGNLLFRSSQRATELEPVLEEVLERRFELPIRVVVRTSSEIARIARAIPDDWIGDSGLRVTVGFLLRGTSAQRVAARLKPRAGVDELTTAPGALIWATRRDALTRTGLRLIGTETYRSMTLRNLNTTLKLAELLRT